MEFYLTLFNTSAVDIDLGNNAGEYGGRIGDLVTTIVLFMPAVSP